MREEESERVVCGLRSDLRGDLAAAAAAAASDLDGGLDETEEKFETLLRGGHTMDGVGTAPPDVILSSGLGCRAARAVLIEELGRRLRISLL